MLNNFLKTLLILLFYGSISISQAQEQIGLQDALRYAIEHNTQIANAKLNKQSNYYKIQEIKATGMPQINASSTFDYNARIGSMVLTSEQGTQTIQIGTPYNFNAGIELQQMLYNQAFWAGLKAAKKSDELYDLETIQAKEQIIFNVTQTYYAIQVTAKQREILADNLDKAEKLVALTKIQHENGILKKVDYDRTQVNLMNVKNDIESLDSDYQAYLQTLKFYMGLPVNQAITLRDSINTPNLTAVQELNLANRTELKILDKQVELQNLNSKVIKAGYLPSLTAHANYRQNALGNEGQWTWFDNATIGATLAIPIFDGFDKRSKIQQSNIRIKQLALTEENTKAQFEMEYSNAVNQLRNRQSIVKKQEANMALANEVYRTTQEQLAQGVASLSDILNAENSLKQAQTGYLQSLIQVKVSELAYLKANGDLESLLK